MIAQFFAYVIHQTRVLGYKWLSNNQAYHIKFQYKKHYINLYWRKFKSKPTKNFKLDVDS